MLRQEHLWAAVSLGAGWWLRLSDVIFPSALPSLLHGLRLGTGLGWFCVVASEMMPPDERAAYAANAAYAAISAAKALLEAYHSDNPESEAERVADAAAIARDAANSADDRVAHAAELDWDMLRRMFLGKYPDFGEPVNAAETGILGALFHDAASSKQGGSLSDDETTVDHGRSRGSRTYTCAT